MLQLSRFTTTIQFPVLSGGRTAEIEAIVVSNCSTIRGCNRSGRHDEDANQRWIGWEKTVRKQRPFGEQLISSSRGSQMIS
jgi:hypothetical protein